MKNQRADSSATACEKVEKTIFEKKSDKSKITL